MILRFYDERPKQIILKCLFGRNRNYVTMLWNTEKFLTQRMSCLIRHQLYKSGFIRTVPSVNMSFTISSRFQDIFNSFKNKTINQLSKINPAEKINNVIEYPQRFLKEMQRTWLITIICITVICCCLVVLHFRFQGYCRRKRTRIHNRDLFKLSTIMTQNKY